MRAFRNCLLEALQLVLHPMLQLVLQLTLPLALPLTLHRFSHCRSRCEVISFAKIVIEKMYILFERVQDLIGGNGCILSLDATE